MDMLINIGALVGAYLGMEFIAWFAHKYVMHGFLWSLHKDHHQKDITRFFERNDFFFLLFATPGITLMIFGMMGGYDFRFYIGIGIALYGFTYFLVHDIFIHQRFKFWRFSDLPYFKAARRAHMTHHKYLEKDDGECFGMLSFPSKFLKEELNKENK